MLELDKEVCKIVKRGFHKASLQHHPDKLGIAAEDLSEVQGGLWRSIQQASVVLSDTSLRRVQARQIARLPLSELVFSGSLNRH
jgi:DnaJ-class molecular chaperone